MNTLTNGLRSFAGVQKGEKAKASDFMMGGLRAAFFCTLGIGTLKVGSDIMKRAHEPHEQHTQPTPSLYSSKVNDFEGCVAQARLKVDGKEQFVAGGYGNTWYIATITQKDAPRDRSQVVLEYNRNAYNEREHDQPLKIAFDTQKTSMAMVQRVADCSAKLE